MRLLVKDLGPAKIAFLSDPFPSRKIPAVLDRVVLRPDICSISHDSRSTLFQVQFLSHEFTLNDLTSDPLTRLKKNSVKKPMRVLLRRFAERFSAITRFVHHLVLHLGVRQARKIP
jgi:hypothetical protein